MNREMADMDDADKPITVLIKKPRFIAKGPREAKDPDDQRLWFLLDTRSGMPVWDAAGIAWFTRAGAKAKAAMDNLPQDI